MLPNIHVLGIQGSGKGTQSALLVERYSLSYISSGELFRRRAEEDDEFGLVLREELASGRLLSDEQLFQTVGDYLRDTAPEVGLLGDGVIRTVEQYAGLMEVWSCYGLDLPLLIHLELTDDIAQERIAKRRHEQGSAARADDNPEAIARRFRLFHEVTEPVISLFEAAGRCVHIPADRTVKEIQADIRRALEKFYPELSHVAH